ncbi:cytochrome b-c1 complex subunit 8 [Pogona vitticeps]|uniref:Cytochrome b-c1 complex subunit 8 n=1 Tax=Pogona vitticeps TaxID=103695 RepID=A0A6J0TXB8_9SAUR|nr:cytochrome b-c1 complex subunit 8 [Pogona vitticeps]
MGRTFGQLARMRHIVTYKLSPFEQKMFPNSLLSEALNFWRRFSSQALRVAPPFIVWYLVCSWGTEEYERSVRKNPADYANDK